MTEQIPTTKETHAEEAFRKKIEADDAKYGIIESPSDETIPSYYLRRSDGSIERWKLVGRGPERGKFTSHSDEEGTMYKYLDVVKVVEQQQALEMEFMIQRAKAVTDLGAEAADAVPVIGPNDPLITELPRFAKPTQQSIAQAFERPVQSAEAVQNGKYEYLRTALPPTVRPEGRSKYSSGFGQYRAESLEDKQRNYYDKFVTDENRQASLDTLDEAMKATPVIRDVLEQYGLKPYLIESVDAIRENPEVRFEVAKLLAEKLDRLLAEENDMGWRIRSNSADNIKADEITGRRMSSRTHAVALALKMIGGEFSERNVGSVDTIERDENDFVVQGQHRHAAVTTLMSYH
jgi:hypothetical protein